MTKSDSGGKWYNGPLASNVLGGLIVGFMIWFVPWAIAEATKAKVSPWVYVVVAVGTLIVLSWIIPTWRKVTWLKVRTWRPLTTTDGISKKVHAAKTQQMDDLKTVTERLNKLRATPGADLTAMLKAGNIPPGITFRQWATWQAAEKVLLSSRPRADEDGPQYSGSQVAPQTAAGEKPAPPLPRPRWTVAPANAPARENKYVIANVVPRSVAREVRIETDSDGMEIIDAGHWEDLSPQGDQQEAMGFFKGIPTEYGESNGVWVTIVWYDENGERNEVRRQLWPPSPDDDSAGWTAPSGNTPF